MNDINLLMSRIDEINKIENVKDLTTNDIDTLILYYRRERQRRASGEKPTKGNKPVADLASLLNLPTSRPTHKPSTGTLRRI